ncbi:RDD family protein [Metabacillus herbersteinensis]|uniref:RDD family protein n=1 Tax=Metabacillus herbersteinensis TaxID=283816 RepID=A0ABV6GAI3_9BACI
METNIIEQKEVVEKKQSLAGVGTRFLAYLLDSLFIGIPLNVLVVVLMFLIFGTSESMEMLLYSETAETELTDAQAAEFLGRIVLFVGLTFIIGFAGAIAYYAGMHSSKWQATLGKKILGIKVTDLNGNRISFWRALGRLMSMQFLSGILMIGFIITFFTEKKQSLHDLIASTIVVKED